jgi:hypothetical protein
LDGILAARDGVAVRTHTVIVGFVAPSGGLHETGTFLERKSPWRRERKRAEARGDTTVVAGKTLTPTLSQRERGEETGTF